MEAECQEETSSAQSDGAILDISGTEMIRLETICRLCANHSEKIIGIYSEEGISNGLPLKMNLYLPIKVAEGDSLPLQCCWSCASTVLAWHELVVTSVEADRRLRELQIVSDNQLQSNEDEAKTSSSPEHECLEKAKILQDPMKYEDDDNGACEETCPPIFNAQPDRYECQACNKKFTKQTLLVSHEMRRHKFDSSRAHYECETCKVKFETENLLAAHKMGGHRRRKRTDINYTIFCDICNKGYTRRFDMEKHRRSKHSNFKSLKTEEEEEEEDKQPENKDFDNFYKAEDFLCKMCEAKFAKHSDLKAHEKKVHGVYKFRRKQGEVVAEYFCDVCNKGFTRKHDMVKHRMKQHPDEPLPETLLSKKKERANFLKAAKIMGPDGETCYKCKTCERVFKQSYNLMRHQTTHTGVRAFFCHICGKNYPSSNGLKRHINEHHYGIKKYACDICGKRFAASVTRNEHLNIHTDTRPFVCDVCGKSFKQKASLYTHKLFHSNNFKFSCNVCGKKFRRGTELKVHSWLHTGHKPHKCHLCSSSFRLRKDLKMHVLVHDKLNECVCNECGSIFSQEKYLNNHKRTHKTHKLITVLPPT